jgi:hypothetical protein
MEVISSYNQMTLRKIIILCCLLSIFIIPSVAADISTFSAVKSCWVQGKSSPASDFPTLVGLSTGYTQGSANNTDGTVGYHGSSSSNLYDILYRTWITFDTRSLEGKYISNVTLCIKLSANEQYLGDDKLDIVYPFPDDVLSPISSDYDKFGTNIYAQSNYLSTYSSSDWVNLSFSDDGIINKTGYTAIGLRLDNDVSITTPTWSNLKYTRINYESQDNTNYHPLLIVEYSDTPPVDYNYQVIVHGLNTEPIYGAEVKLYYDGSLQDTSTTDVNGDIRYVIPILRWVNGTVTKSGYQPASFSQYINTWDTWTSVTLYTENETPGSGDEYWNYIVTFRDASTLEQITNVFIDVYTDSGRTDLFILRQIGLILYPVHPYRYIKI